MSERRMNKWYVQEVSEILSYNIPIDYKNEEEGLIKSMVHKGYNLIKEHNVGNSTKRLVFSKS